MATIDSRIAMGFQPTTQIESPMNNLARLLQVQGAQQANALNQMKMEEYQSGIQSKNKLMALIQPDYASDEERESAVLRGGFPEVASKLRSDRLAAAKSGVELDEKRFKLAKDRYDTYRQTLGALAQNPNLSKGLVAQAGQQLVDAGVIPAELHQKALVSMSEDPALLRRSMLEGAAAQMPTDKMLEFFAPKVDKTDNGQQIMYRDSNPNSPTFGQMVGGAPVQKMQTPDSIASNETTRRGQNMVDDRARERLTLDQGNAVADAGGPSQVNLTKQFGKAPPGYRWKPDGTAEAIPGGPADIKAGEAGVKAQQRKDAAALAAGNVLDAVKSAKDLVGVTTTGPGSLLSKVPGTNARDLQAKLDTVKANLGFDRLQQMREMSPTGGALGAVAVQELIALQSTVASLDQAQSPTELKNSLEKIEGHYKKWLETVGATSETESNPGVPKPGTVKNGYRFKGGDPANQNNWEKL